MRTLFFAIICFGDEMPSPNKRLQPTLGSPRAAEARRWAIKSNAHVL